MNTERFNELLKDIRNPESFNEIFDEYYAQIIKISMHIYGSAEDARDVAQEIFKYLLTHEIKTYVKNPHAWFYALCKYNGQKLYKKELPLQDDVESQDAIYQFVSFEMRSALQKLSPNDRDLILMYWFYGFTLREIAQITHKSFLSVAKQHERAKKKLKKIMST